MVETRKKPIYAPIYKYDAPEPLELQRLQGQLDAIQATWDRAKFKFTSFSFVDVHNQKQEFSVILENHEALTDIFQSSLPAIASLKTEESIAKQLTYNELSPGLTTQHPEAESAERYNKNLDIINEIKKKTVRVDIVKRLIEQYVITQELFQALVPILTTPIFENRNLPGTAQLFS